jgi:hypothetical protein
MGDWGNQGPVRLMNFREWVPDKIRFWLYVCIFIAFQFSNGFYFTTMAQLVGERALTMNDTHMLGQTVLIGLTFYFPLAFRLKFRFTNRTSLTIAAAGMALVNLLFPYVHSYAGMLVLCYLGGFFRLYGTFECFSNILPKVAPTYNYAVFLSFVFFIVLGCVQVFDWFAIRVIYYYDWQHVHLLAIGLCLLVILLVNVTMQHYRPMPKMPLLGLDPLGMLLWSLFILTAIYVVLYGEQYDWLHDGRIRGAIGICCLLLAACLSRMYHIRHAFLEKEAFHCPNLWNMLLLFLCLDILLGTQNVLQNTFTDGILGYGQLTASQLKWPEFLGALASALFFKYFRVNRGWHLKTMLFIAMSAVVLYNVWMTQLISPAIDILQLWPPLILLGFGHVGVFIALTVYAQAYCNFKYYFQVLCILGLIRTGIGDPIGIALWEHALQGEVNEHLATIGAAADFHFANAGWVAQEAVLSALRTLYARAVLFGSGVLVLILCAHFDRLRNPLPKLRQAYTIVSKALQGAAAEPKESVMEPSKSAVEE